MVKDTQTIFRQQPTNCLSVFGHFVELGLKGLTVILLLLHSRLIYLQVQTIWKLIAPISLEITKKLLYIYVILTE